MWVCLSVEQWCVVYNQTSQPLLNTLQVSFHQRLCILSLGGLYGALQIWFYVMLCYHCQSLLKALMFSMSSGSKRSFRFVLLLRLLRVVVLYTRGTISRRHFQWRSQEFTTGGCVRSFSPSRQRESELWKTMSHLTLCCQSTLFSVAMVSCVGLMLSLQRVRKLSIYFSLWRFLALLPLLFLSTLYPRELTIHHVMTWPNQRLRVKKKKKKFYFA